MNAGGPSIDALLAAARAEFAASLPGKVTELEDAVAVGAWDEARRGAHKLRGSAAAYGFAPVASVAGAIEELLLRPGPLAEADRVLLAAQLLEARREAQRAGSGSE